MSHLDREYVRSIIESLLKQADRKEATSFFHHRRIDDHVSQMETDATRLVLTVAPHDEFAEPLELNQHIDNLQEPATRIAGIRSTKWGSAGATFRFSNREHPSLHIDRFGRIEYTAPHLVEEGGVVPVRVLLPLIGSVEVARHLSEEVGLEGPLQIDVTLLGVGGSRFHTPPRRAFHAEYAFDDDRIHQRQVIETAGRRSDIEVRPLADRLWQSSGFSECHSYDDEGQWTAWANHFN